MMLLNFFLFLLFLFVLIKCAGYAIKHSSRLAKALKFPEFVVSFFVVAFISVLPEATISIISAIEGEPQLGLGTLIGSNVADLTLVFGIVALMSSNGLKVKSKIIQDKFYYLFLLLFPLLLGLDGEFSRLDGIFLILVGLLFFVKIYKDSKRFNRTVSYYKKESIIKSIFLLVFSLGIIFICAYFTVEYAERFAYDIKIPSVLIGLSIVAIGTCLPELIFSIRAVKKSHDGLALGDLLGTVITDATIILGLVALISPFNYDPNIIYFTGTSMFLAGFILISFMKSDRLIKKWEGAILIMLYILFLLIGLLINHIAIR